MVSNSNNFLLALILLAFTNGFAQEIIIGEIIIVGNKKTKDSFILRELLFEMGDTLQTESWDKIKIQCENNLNNTSLFLNAELFLKQNDQIASVEVVVSERWYFWPVPQFNIDERNFNTWFESKNLSRASGGMFLTHNNMRGRGEVLNVLLMVGYNRKVGLSYEIPYLNKKKTFGIGFQSIYSLRHEVNASTEFDKQEYLKTKEEAIQTDWINALQFTYRPKYYFTHLLQLRYHEWYFADTLLDFNPQYSLDTSNTFRYFGFYYKLKLDHRDYAPYPLKGYYIDFEIFKYGLGIVNHNLNMISFKSTSRKYWQINKHWFWAGGIIAKVSNHQKQPYLLQRGLGYGRDFVRAYEYYVIDGQDFFLAKANLKYALLSKKVIKFERIPAAKFNTIPISLYLNLFSDFGIVNNRQAYSSTNLLPNQPLYSVGLGLDFVSYYDMVGRFEVAINHFGETNFYLHFIAPI
jgi:outer membrane protein assembly factor BamA